ncbi:MAG: FAD-dependent oxidoreductase [Rhodocyclaceae bacterium]|nr:FAD-dependent oxidoreductase [Rhodocyclaceae bacterium]MCA3135618.1 FAD-dependent oxidoreductase [Rhodocyclaceae bacterium]MCA3141593.1 FAD-dependent oxidoreductase [Rhodocyclaceae bacterium]MCA3146983.1 FAD-dependent oxidoreductase [Rhodocyclaceae bacterium]
MRRVLLVGGGHAHVEVVRRLGPACPAGVEVVLVSPATDTPYSGMLPGLVAGHYSWRECHIDLVGLCARSRVVFRQGALVALDAGARVARLEDGSSMEWDWLSLDVGSTPPVDRIEGAHEHGMAVKPVNLFLEGWEALLARARSTPLRLAVVGGGAGGVELAFALRYRLDHDSGEGGPCDLTLVSQSGCILPDHALGVRRRVEAALRRAGVGLLMGAAVGRATAEGLELRDGGLVPCHCALWATGAAAPRWLRTSGLALDAQGFVQVDATLRSISHPKVFAAGDVAALMPRGVPKSGVYAVRQGPVLAGNLLRGLEGHAPRRFLPQQQALALMSTGSRYAIASRGAFHMEGAWVWCWKDRIDRAFMARYA